MKQRLQEINYHRPPYCTRYPHLAELDKYFAAGNGVPPEGNVITHNISVGGNWLEIGWHADAKMIDIHDNLVNEDPHFLNPTALNFQLRDDSPAYKLGFQRIPVEKIGLYQDDYRRSVPPRTLVQCALEMLEEPLAGDEQTARPGHAPPAHRECRRRAGPRETSASRPIPQRMSGLSLPSTIPFNLPFRGKKQLFPSPLQCRQTCLRSA